MHFSTPKPPEPLTDFERSVGRSYFKTCVFLTGFFVWFAVGLFLISAFFLGIPDGAAHVTWYGLLVGLVSLVLGPFFGFRWLRLLLVGHRILIGRECFQVVERVSGVDTVLLQIPYANIAELRTVNAIEHRVTGVLRRVDFTGTYAPSIDLVENMNRSKYHFFLSDGYALSAVRLREAILSRSQRPS